MCMKYWLTTQKDVWLGEKDVKQQNKQNPNEITAHESTGVLQLYHMIKWHSAQRDTILHVHV